MDPFKIQRRNSLHLETDGIWDGLENEEDAVVEHRIKLNECMMLRRMLGQDKSDILPKARGVTRVCVWLVCAVLCARAWIEAKPPHQITPHPTWLMCSCASRALTTPHDMTSHHTNRPARCRPSPSTSPSSPASPTSATRPTSVRPRCCLIPSHLAHAHNLTTPIHHHPTPKAGRVSINECHHLSDTLKMVAGGSTALPGACSAMLKKEEHDLAEKFEEENAKVCVGCGCVLT